MSDLHSNAADIAMQAGQRQVWDETARDFSDAAAIASPASEIISKRLIALAHVTSGQRVLDVATGAGDPALTAAQVVGPSFRAWASVLLSGCS